LELYPSFIPLMEGPPFDVPLVEGPPFLSPSWRGCRGRGFGLLGEQSLQQPPPSLRDTSASGGYKEGPQGEEIPFETCMFLIVIFSAKDGIK
jgi:hypothetical protein